ncbi:MAG TPA: PAS domain S-box protein [Opitutaceae bacterium]
MKTTCVAWPRRVLWAAAWALGLASAVADSADPEVVDLQLPGAPRFEHAGYYAAIEQGYFQSEGVEVAVRHAASRATPLSSLAAGEADYAVGGADFLAARLQGSPIVMVTTVFQETEQALRVVGPGEITTPAALVGRAVQLASPLRSAPLRIMLLQEGAGPERVRWLEPHTGGEGSPGAEAVQASVHDGEGFYLRPADFGVAYFYGAALFTTEAELAHHPLRVAAMRRAVLRGWDYALRHSPAVIELLTRKDSPFASDRTPEQLAYEATVVRGLIKPATVPLGTVEPARLREAALALVELRLAGNTDRLKGFAYDSRVGSLPRWVGWLAALLVVTGAVALVIVIINLRLQRAVQSRTRQLVRSEARFRELVENAPVSILEEDFSDVAAWLERLRAEGVADLRAWLARRPEELRQQFTRVRMVSANRVALATLGATDLEDYARRLIALYSPQVGATFLEELVALWEGRSALTHEFSYPTSDDTVAQCVMHWTVPNHEGRPDVSRVLLVFTDTTVLRSTEAQLREVRDRWELAVRGLNVGIWECNFVTGEAFFSDRSKEMLGYGPDELPDDQAVWQALVHPEDRALAAVAMAAHLAGRAPLFRVEHRFRCKDGSYKWIMSRGRVLFDAEQRPQRIVGGHSDIHARKEAEEALRANVERYRLLFDQNPSPMWVYDRETLRFLDVNAAAVRHYGYTRAEFLGMTIFDIRPLEEVERLQAALAASASAGGASGVWRHRRKDGSIMFMDVTAQDHDYAGRSGVLVIVQDVTERHLAEERVRASEERYRTLFESAVEGVYESTPAEGLRRANPALARIFGYANPESLIEASRGCTGALYAQPHRREEFLAALGREDSLFDFESEVRCADGSTRWISENVRAVRDADGQLLHLQGFVSDITERKRFETAFAAERERLRVTLQAMAEAVITTDRGGLVQFMNEAAEQLTGWADGAAIGRHIDQVAPFRHERTHAALPAPVVEALASAAVVELPRHTTLMHRQGGACLVDGRCAPMFDPQSKPVGTVLVLRDVTERARLEAEMLRASKLESVGVLAGGIAHDFNNLLTVVMGNLTLAMLDSQVASTAGKWLAEAERGAFRARDLTQQLLTFAKGGAPIRTAVQLPEVVREAAQFALHGSKVRCDFHSDPALWAADVDKGQIGQVVQNLVLNAVQAMPEGGTVRIALHNERNAGDAVRAFQPGDYLRIEIVDTGPGIRPEHIGRVFDPYFTTKESGSGLGLATVYSIVKKHAGHIEVESEPGRGTTFRIWLPAVPGERTKPVEPAETQAQLSGRVLFMDDEDTIRSMAHTLLTRLGFEVTTVADGAEAVRAYGEARAAGRPYQVVIMDLTVPGGMGGKEAMHELRKLDPDVRAIVSSGYSSDPVMANYQAHGFHGMVAKPYRVSDLAKALRSVLDAGAS